MITPTLIRTPERLQRCLNANSKNPKIMKILIFACFSYFVFSVEILIPSVISLPLSVYFHLSPLQFSILPCFLAITGILGGYIWGHFADIYGREICFRCSLILLIAFDLASTYTQQWPVFILFRCLANFGLSALQVIIPVVVSEYFGHHMRGSRVMIYSFFGSLGVVLFTLFAFLYLHSIQWQFLLQLALLPSLLLFIFSIAIRFESAKYFLSHKKFDQLDRLILDMKLLQDDFESELSRPLVQSNFMGDPHSYPQRIYHTMDPVDYNSFTKPSGSTVSTPLSVHSNISCTSTKFIFPRSQSLSTYSHNYQDQLYDSSESLSFPQTQENPLSLNSISSISIGNQNTQDQDSLNNSQSISSLSRFQRLGQLFVFWFSSLNKPLFIMFFIYLFFALGYWGVTILLPEFLVSIGSDNPYRDVFYIQLASLPGVVLAYFIIDKFERKHILSAVLFGSSVSCAGASFTGSYNITPLIIIFLGFLYFFMIPTFSILQLVVCELFPTKIRSRSLGISSMGMALPAAGAPFISAVLLDQATWFLANYSISFLFAAVLTHFVLPKKLSQYTELL